MIPRLLLIACVLVLAAGCGQKGPLYLPGDAPQDESDEQSTD